jgi:antitoxin (DNA-binding transcriptional repressor) of toxin-antitoxin stability system
LRAGWRSRLVLGPPRLGVYPELADDTSSLGSLLAGASARRRAARRLARERRQVLEIPRTIGITEIQRRVASILDEVGEGRPTAIYSSGKYVGFFITPAEYYRLRKLSRVVSWFRTAGLDLATADEAEIAGFVRRFRDARHRPESAVG